MPRPYEKGMTINLAEKSLLPATHHRSMRWEAAPSELHFIWYWLPNLGRRSPLPPFLSPSRTFIEEGSWGNVYNYI